MKILVFTILLGFGALSFGQDSKNVSPSPCKDFTGIYQGINSDGYPLTLTIYQRSCKKIDVKVRFTSSDTLDNMEEHGAAVANEKINPGIILRVSDVDINSTDPTVIPSSSDLSLEQALAVYDTKTETLTIADVVRQAQKIVQRMKLDFNFKGDSLHGHFFEQNQVVTAIIDGHIMTNMVSTTDDIDFSRKVTLK